RLPPGLTASAAARHQVAGKGSVLEGGINILQIDASAVRDLGYSRIESEVHRSATILAVVPDRGLIVRAKPGAIQEVAALPFIEAVGAFEPAYKIDPLVGLIPLIKRSRAASSVMELVVPLWEGSDRSAARSRIAAIVGDANVSNYSADGASLLVNATKGQIIKLAHDPDVAHIE